MPLPKPLPNEKKEDFIGRCIPAVSNLGEYSQEQTVAICYSQWNNRKKKGDSDMGKFNPDTNTLAKVEPKWGEVDKTKLPREAFADQGETDKKSTWRYPHHYVQGGGDLDANGTYSSGKFYLHRGGLAAARQRAAQNNLTGAALKHLNDHAKAIGMGEEKKKEDSPYAWPHSHVEIRHSEVDDLPRNLRAKSQKTKAEELDDLFPTTPPDETA